MSDIREFEKELGEMRLQVAELRARVDILQLALLGVVDRSKRAAARNADQAPETNADQAPAREWTVPPQHLPVLRLIAESGWTTAEGLGAALGRSRKSVRLSVERLQHDGLLQKSGRQYVLTNFGKSIL